MAVTHPRASYHATGPGSCQGSPVCTDTTVWWGQPGSRSRSPPPQVTPRGLWALPPPANTPHNHAQIVVSSHSDCCTFPLVPQLYPSREQAQGEPAHTPKRGRVRHDTASRSREPGSPPFPPPPGWGSRGSGWLTALSMRQVQGSQVPAATRRSRGEVGAGCKSC